MGHAGCTNPKPRQPTSAPAAKATHPTTKDRRTKHQQLQRTARGPQAPSSNGARLRRSTLQLTWRLDPKAFQWQGHQHGTMETIGGQRGESRVRGRRTHLSLSQPEQAIGQANSNPGQDKEEGQKDLPQPEKRGRGGDLEGSSPDGYNPTSQEARDQDVECGACQQSAGHAAPDAGAGSGDAPGHKHDATRAPALLKAGSKCARLRRTLSKLATKAGFRTANTLCTAIILCIMLFAFLVLAKELGWHVLHPSNSFKDLQ